MTAARRASPHRRAPAIPSRPATGRWRSSEQAPSRRRPPPGARSTARWRWSHLLTGDRLFAPSQHPLHEKLIAAIGREAEKGDGKHDGEHRLVGPIGAERADQIAETLPRDDQFGTDQEDERQSQRRADAVE